MEFSFEPSQAKIPRNRLKSTVRSASTADIDSGDRLQKAIERNRAKQARRSAPSAQRRPTATRPVSRLPSGKVTSTLTSRLQQSGLEEVVIMPKRPSRRNVAVGGRASFSEPIKNKTKIAAPVRYMGLGKSKAKVSRKSKKLLDHLVVFGWVCIFVLSIQLIFSDRGIVDYYQHQNSLEMLQHEQEQIITENSEIVTEVKKIKESSRYQKKIVRDNLGFIGQQEYLILFAKGRAPANTN